MIPLTLDPQKDLGNSLTTPLEDWSILGVHDGFIDRKVCLQVYKDESSMSHVQILFPAGFASQGDHNKDPTAFPDGARLPNPWSNPTTPLVNWPNFVRKKPIVHGGFINIIHCR